jgi:hypothetical protein
MLLEEVLRQRRVEHVLMLLGEEVLPQLDGVHLVSNELMKLLRGARAALGDVG